MAQRACNHRDADSGIACGALDNGAAWAKRAAPNRVVDDRERCAVLDRTAGIHELGLAEYCATCGLRGGAKLDERRAADRPDDIMAELHRAPRKSRPR